MSPARLLEKQGTVHLFQAPGPQSPGELGARAQLGLGNQAYLNTWGPRSPSLALSPCLPIPQPRQLCLESVALQGLPGTKRLVLINGGQP